MAGCATPTGSAGHAGATANLKLTFHLDHSAGADHSRVAEQRYLAAMLEDATFWIAIAVTVAGLVAIAVSIARS